jgi:hypothetical protein
VQLGHQAAEPRSPALDAYLHPNYGSHIAALFPERTEAARLLLECLIAVYEAFFDLSWAERPIPKNSRPLDLGPVKAWPRTAERFQLEILPEVRRQAENPTLAEVMMVPRVLKWLTAESADLDAILQDPNASPPWPSAK